MSSMRYKARLDTSHYGPPHPFKDAGVVANSLTRIHNTTVKCIFFVNRSCLHKRFQAPPQLKIQIWRGARRPCNGSSSTYPSVMIAVTENISHSAADMCRSTVMHVQCSFSHNSQMKYFRTRGDLDILYWHWNSCPKFVRTFQLHPVYIHT
jgi:hypothetical protein